MLMYKTGVYFGKMIPPREAALAVIGNAPGDHGYDRGVDYSYEAVQNLPVAPVAEVVHGYWIANNICSACKRSIKGYAIQQGYVICPYCGAKMDAKWNAANPKSVNKVIHGDESCICITCEHDGKDYQGCEDMYCPVTECKDYKEAEPND